MEPLFVEDKQDFPLAYCGEAGATPALAEAETRRLEEAYGRWHREQDWDAVADLWILHDKLRDEKLSREDPLAWAAFERTGCCVLSNYYWPARPTSANAASCRNDCGKESTLRHRNDNRTSPSTTCRWLASLHTRWSA